jgi:MerC mercury resistance protein
MNTTATAKWEDAIGASVSIACAIHCLAAPFLVALAPVLVGETAEKWLSGFLILLSGVILARGWKTHRHVGPPLVFLVGASLLVIGRLSHALPHELEHVVIVTVALFFVGAHVYNFKCSKKCCGSETH